VTVCLEGLAIKHSVNKMTLGHIATVTSKGAVLMIILVRLLFLTEPLYCDSTVQMESARSAINISS
jgi:hypothetical protein